MKKVKILAAASFLLAFLILNILLVEKPQAKEKKKILVLQIIEENWDNLEFYPPKYECIIKDCPSKKTKKEVIKKIGLPADINKVKIDMEKVKKEGYPYVNYMLSDYLPKQGVNTKNIEMFVVHNLKYYGKTGEMKDNDLVEEAIYRFGKYLLQYYYEEIPKKISLLIDPKCGGHNCTHIRLVDDINILSSDKSGDLKINYSGETYNLKVGDKIQFPVKEVTMTKDEIQNWTEKYMEKFKARWGYQYNINSCHPSIIITKGNIYFKTKVILINLGYLEVEL